MKEQQIIKVSELNKLEDHFRSYPTKESIGLCTERFDDIRKLCLDGVLNPAKVENYYLPSFYQHMKSHQHKFAPLVDINDVCDDREFMGVIPYELMYSLLREFKGPKGQKLSGMSVKITNDKAFPNQPGEAYYYMLHWNEKKTNYQKGHWLESCVVSLQEDSIERIDHFAMAMIEAIGCKEKKTNYMWYPGFVYTVRAYQQIAHVDIPYEYEMMENNEIDPKELSWIVHAPLQQTGGMISIWNRNKNEHRYQYIPFGCFVAIRSDVIHSGVYGLPGNARFHLVICLQKHIRSLDKLTQFKGTAVEPGPEWSALYVTMMQQSQSFADYYSHGFLKSYPSLNTAKYPNYLGNLNPSDVGLNDEHIRANI